ncbi:MAG: Slp family lipoprotein [Wenzhouxiangella sp.]
MKHAFVRPALALVAMIVLLLASGCATTPAPLTGDFAEFQPDQATDRSVNARVRWGGHIVDTQPTRDQTCIEILARDLDRDARPQAGDQNHGRFLACRDGFQDPAVFTSGREVTVVGNLEGFTDGQIGEFEYRYPRLHAETLYLWAERPDTVVYPYYDPWWPHRYHYYGPRRHHFHGSRRFSGRFILVR